MRTAHGSHRYATMYAGNFGAALVSFSFCPMVVVSTRNHLLSSDWSISYRLSSTRDHFSTDSNESLSHLCVHSRQVIIFSFVFTFRPHTHQNVSLLTSETLSIGCFGVSTSYSVFFKFTCAGSCCYIATDLFSYQKKIICNWRNITPY